MPGEVSSPADLHPRSIRRAELLLLPLFWFGLLLAVILWKLIVRDKDTIREQVDGEWPPGGGRSIPIYIMAWLFGLLAFPIYRLQRLTLFRQAFDLDEGDALDDYYEAFDVSRGWPVRIWAAVQLLTFIGLVVVPTGSVLVEITAVVLLANLVVGPVLVLYDLYRLGQTDVSWGWTRWLFVPASALFPFLFLYLLHRMEHVQYRFVYEELSDGSGTDQLAQTTERHSAGSGSR